MATKRQIEAECRRLQALVDELRAENDELRSRARATREKPTTKKIIKNNKLEVVETREAMPPGWERAAAAERERDGSEVVCLQSEWRKMLAYDAARGRGFPTLGRWLGWARIAWLDHTNRPALPEAADEAGEAESGTVALPQIGTDREQARAASYRRTGKWAPPGQAAEWGPAPGMPGCTLPAALAAWAQQNGPAKAAGPLQSDGVAAGLSRRAGSHTGRSGRARAACAPLPA